MSLPKFSRVKNYRSKKSLKKGLLKAPLTKENQKPKVQLNDVRRTVITPSSAKSFNKGNRYSIR